MQVGTWPCLHHRISLGQNFVWANPFHDSGPDLILAPAWPSRVDIVRHPLCPLKLTISLARYCDLFPLCTVMWVMWEYLFCNTISKYHNSYSNLLLCRYLQPVMEQTRNSISIISIGLFSLYHLPGSFIVGAHLVLYPLRQVSFFDIGISENITDGRFGGDRWYECRLSLCPLLWDEW